ncbi:MAG: ABC transporter ATP-binding protein [Sphingomonadaceae bacterium]|nr:ABC transporter ATP-binding protein [Sphingomonadaceae bacterium]
MTGPEVSFENVSKSYDGALAVDDVSLIVAPASFVALVGESGSGKSTLLKLVNRLIEPGAGAIHIGGEPIAARDHVGLRRSIGYVFQNIGLFPHMTVAENIGIIPRLSGQVGGHDIGELLALVGLAPDLADRFPRQLSGGQQQRVGVARALAGGESLMLMDEPFGALDPVTRDQLGQAYRDLHDRLGLTTIMVTHDMAEALLLADRVLVMREGRIVADATPRELLASEQSGAAGELLAVPRRQAERIRALEQER